MSDGNGNGPIWMYLMHKNRGGAHRVTSETPGLEKTDRRITDKLKGSQRVRFYTVRFGVRRQDQGRPLGQKQT